MGQARHRKAEIDALKRAGPKPRAIRSLGQPRHDSISLVAVHEAGHAYGRFITADLMGLSKEGAVWCIEMHHPETTPTFHGKDGKLYRASATTFGPLFSRAIEDVSRIVDGRYMIDRSGCDEKRVAEVINSQEYSVAVIAEARAAGINIKEWATAKIIQGIAGPAAEAKARHISVDDVLYAPECTGDVNDIGKANFLAGLSTDELSNLLNKGVNMLAEQWSDPKTWNALLLLARSLPMEGRVEGAQCWATYSAALVNPDVVLVV